VDDSPIVTAGCTMVSKQLATAALVLLGLMFIAGPLASAFHLAPEPVLPPRAAAFMWALADSGYMFPLLWAGEIAAGILVLSGALPPMGLVLLAPVVLNIAAFHLFLAPANAAPAIVACAVELFLAWHYRAAYEPLFRNVRVGNPFRRDRSYRQQGST